MILETVLFIRRILRGFVVFLIKSPLYVREKYNVTTIPYSFYDAQIRLRLLVNESEKS